MVIHKTNPWFQVSPFLQKIGRYAPRTCLKILRAKSGWIANTKGPSSPEAQPRRPPSLALTSRSGAAAKFRIKPHGLDPIFSVLSAV